MNIFTIACTLLAGVLCIGLSLSIHRQLHEIITELKVIKDAIRSKR
jgi:hypothetical protein